MNDQLSHVRADGSAHMVDVTEKATTSRTSRAQAVVVTRSEVIDMIMTGGLPKGDALPVARVAGIMAAKKTWETIPLCHPIPLGKLTVDFEADADAGTIRVETLVKTTGVTGVEMEALSAASTAALTVYDMIKAVDPRAGITDIKVLEKTGGKSGDWSVHESGETPRDYVTAAVSGHPGTSIGRGDRAAAGGFGATDRCYRSATCRRSGD